ncbi:type IV-A pilus assembly ATPase PilB [Moraxella pluranimalium]|uniref:Type IV-A pilus assembly ATPase PilB n=1 Tax=Moraxella pluranimalium TaxID=470453 RepID=A0A1T0CPI5_9GAMM|nr:type IV-A pilus assembly ATPase PilB [Moraxella pluranimalium]OOS24256.1 type IV-A pilus assembly ATPase PilB [Moraxella pluranimalium]
MLSPFHQRLIDHLATLGIDKAVLAETIDDAVMTHTPWTARLIGARLLDAKTLAMAIGQLLSMAVYDVDKLPHAPLTDIIDDKLMARYRVLPLAKDGTMLQLGMSDPTDTDAINAIRFHTHLHITAVLVEEDKLSRWLDKLAIGADASFGELGIDEHSTDGIDSTDDGVLDEPMVRFVNKLLIDAVRLGASDIHFEPYEHSYRIRYRIDGVMSLANTPPKSHANKIATRLKVMAKLDIAERRKPQDGRIKFRLSDHQSVDFRVSTLPTLFGEKIVLRMLDSAQTLIGLDALGMTDKQKQHFVDALAKPQGMILITGPTGSGKTISLYTALGLLNRGDNNILTAEDPVEINLDGINQVNINPKAGFDFADVLAAFLRQDPDVIMIGEIRDSATAEIAVKSAQTGHLVLSTLHTNSSSATITRLHSMGVPSFHLASGISLIIAQRLARRLCDDCKRPITMPTSALIEAGFGDSDIANTTVLYEPVGCHRCRDGYRGRVGIFEMMPISPTIRKLILEQADSSAIDDANAQAGNPSLRQAGIAKVIAGLTDLSEMHRVTSQ